MAILTQAEYEELKRQEFLSEGRSPKSARQKARNTARYIYQAVKEVYNTETGRTQKPGETPKRKTELNIVLPQNITAEPKDAKEQIAFDTDKYGELVVTGIGDEFKTGSRLSGITLKTNQGDFLFVEEGYVNQGYLDSSDTRYKNPLQYYSRAFTGDQRDEIFDSAVSVDISSIPDDHIGGYRGRETLYGITGGRAGDISDLPTKKGILIPSDVAKEANIKANSYRLSDTVGRITGIVDTSNNPYVDEEFVYAREGSATAPKGEVGLRYIDKNGQTRYTYSWQDSGGIFSNFTGIDFLDNTLGGISDALANIEDIGREGIEGVDAALQNPYVNAVVKTIAAVSPDPITKAIAAGIDAYTTVDSGEDLSAGQIVNLATSTAGAIQASGGAGGTMSADGGPPQTGGATDTSAFDSAVQAATDETVQKIAGAGASIIDGADPLDVVVNVFSDEIIEGVADTADTAIGKEAGDAIRDNPDITNTVIDVAQGDDVSTAIANNLGDRAAEAIGADTTNEVALVKAGLTTGAGLDQGLDTDEALLEGAKTYYEEGGTVDLDIDPNLTGDLDLAFGDTGIDLDPLDLAQTASEALAAGEDAIRDAGSALDDYVSEVIPGEDITQQLSENLAELTDEASDALAQLEDDVSEAIPGEDITQEISEGAAKFEDNVVDALADVDDTVSELIDDQDIPQNIAESAAKLEDNVIDALADVDDYISDNLPEFDMPEGDDDGLGIEGPDLPEVSMPTLDLMQFAGLLGGLSTGGGGKAPAEEEQPGSQYQTQFDFLAGLQPLGMLGNFQRRS